MRVLSKFFKVPFFDMFLDFRICYNWSCVSGSLLFSFTLFLLLSILMDDSILRKLGKVIRSYRMFLECSGMFLDFQSHMVQTSYE